MAPDALIGVDSTSGENGQENLTLMAFTTAFARDAAAYGVPPAIIGKMVQTDPGRMAWLTADLGAKGVWYRLRIGPMDDVAEASNLCRQRDGTRKTPSLGAIV
jgi:hypothetical protein